ncbi:DUF1345 domain-containing protein [Plastoroseomonas hellenica]|uniref:DUF1345 domain-containing protein n=1 Tax=Plastoroseomonas hellenica TaxID=2687306 RepID=UPI001BAD696B|nr:DUF1345 domain-containing protein [Plastoroseomonas hellenica]MBR0644817.1 DUF1345 domain-containing protein [Plastoroseomonas hellenica]
MLRGLRHRPLLLAAVGTGLACGGLLWVAGVRVPTAVLLGWCVTVLTHAVPTTMSALRATPAAIRRRAELLDEGETAVLLTSLGAAGASLVAVFWHLASADGEASPAHVALAIAAIALSWGYVHLLFAIRYAHEYWRAGGGLDLPGGGKPDFPDFLYIAFTIGMTFQTSDTGLATRVMRRLALGHALVSFVFNMIILAAAVNIAAGLVH